MKEGRDTGSTGLLYKPFPALSGLYVLSIGYTGIGNHSCQRRDEGTEAQAMVQTMKQTVLSTADAQKSAVPTHKNISLSRNYNLDHNTLHPN